MVALILGATFSSSIVGCANAEPATPPTTHDDLRGGALATARIYSGIGILGREAANKQDAVTACTGTLIGPKKVITAKHCIRDDAEGPDNRIEEGLYFFVGLRETDIEKRSKVVSAKVPKAMAGGYINYGSDVAVLELEDAITGVPFALTATEHFPTSMVGKRLAMIGYGFDQEEVDGVRRVGAVTLVSNRDAALGRAFPAWGDFMKFIVDVENDPGIAGGEDDREAMAKRAYDYKLLPNYEAFVGLGTNDAQPCRNDSGAPVVFEANGSLVVWAVASGSLKLSESSCGNYGSFVATLGPEVQAILHTP